MTEDAPFQHLRRVDHDTVSALAADERFSQKLTERAAGGTHSGVSYIRTPPGGGSPRGLHVHEWEQIFYILEGTMMIEVDGDQFPAEPGELVVFPAGVPHRNWNAGESPTVHLAVNTPVS